MTRTHLLLLLWIYALLDQTPPAPPTPPVKTVFVHRLHPCPFPDFGGTILLWRLVEEEVEEEAA